MSAHSACLLQVVITRLFIKAEMCLDVGFKVVGAFLIHLHSSLISLCHCMLPRQSTYTTNDVRKASVNYNGQWSITEPIPNRPHLHRDASLKTINLDIPCKSWLIQDQLFSLCCFVEKPFVSSYFSIDASREDTSLGRLVNDCHKSPNCKMRRLTVQGKPHLCLFAIENIQAETEITYDYGDSQWPWRNLVSKTS